MTKFIARKRGRNASFRLPVFNLHPAAGEASWTDEISCLAHWYSLNALSQRLSALPTQSARIQEAERIMQDALTLFAQLDSQNVSFNPMTGPDHIREWQDSLHVFRALAGL